MKSKNNLVNIIRWPALLIAVFILVAAGYATGPAGNVEAASASFSTAPSDNVVTVPVTDKTQDSLSPATNPAAVTAPAEVPDDPSTAVPSIRRGASTTPPPSLLWTPYPPAVRAALEAFGKSMNVSRWQIQVVTVTSTQWPDGCLGLGERNEACTLAIVAGWQIVVRAEGDTYEIRTDLTGSRVRWQLLPTSPITSPVAEAYS